MKRRSRPHVALAFLPVTDLDDQPVKYDIYLLNKLTYDFEFCISCSIANKVIWTKEDILANEDELCIGEIRHEALNDRPDFQLVLNVWDLPPEYLKAIHITQKIRARSFHANLAEDVIYGQSAVYYYLLEKLSVRSDRNMVDLKKIDFKTKRSQYRNHRHPAPEQRANFPAEIDLHIEEILKPEQYPKSGHFLDIQIKAFEKYINEAILLQIPQVFIIHGEGKGILRDEIHRILREDYPNLTSVYQYHPKYGFGATEIRLM